MGWICFGIIGHKGPCAAWPVTDEEWEKDQQKNYLGETFEERDARIEKTIAEGLASGDLTDDGHCSFFDGSTHEGTDKPCECKSAYGHLSKMCHYWNAEKPIDHVCDCCGRHECVCGGPISPTEAYGGNDGGCPA